METEKEYIEITIPNAHIKKLNMIFDKDIPNDIQCIIACKNSLSDILI